MQSLGDWKTCHVCMSMTCLGNAHGNTDIAMMESYKLLWLLCMFYSNIWRGTFAILRWLWLVKTLSNLLWGGWWHSESWPRVNGTLWRKILRCSMFVASQIPEIFTLYKLISSSRLIRVLLPVWSIEKSTRTLPTFWITLQDTRSVYRDAWGFRRTISRPIEFMIARTSFFRQGLLFQVLVNLTRSARMFFKGFDSNKTQ